MQSPPIFEIACDTTPATWAGAKKLHDLANRSASDAVGYAIACGRMLRSLRDSSVTVGGDRRSPSARESVSNVGHCSGFVVELEKVGISRSTAYDWIAQADKFDQLKGIRDGEIKTLTIDVETDSGVKTVAKTVTEKDRKLAAQHIANIEAGLVYPKRAWAGFRSGMMTNGTKRAPTNVYALIREAVASLDRQLPKLTTLTDDERLELKKYAAKTQIIERIAALEDLS